MANNSSANRKLGTAFRLLLTVTLTIGTLAVAPAPVKADEPGRGLTRQFEINYLKFIADHHFSALRMTELAAGTDAVRDAEISPNEALRLRPTPKRRRQKRRST